MTLSNVEYLLKMSVTDCSFFQAARARLHSYRSVCKDLLDRALYDYMIALELKVQAEKKHIASCYTSLLRQKPRRRLSMVPMLRFERAIFGPMHKSS